jgi:hypothetical protein
MLNTNRGGLDRQSDSVWSKVAMERSLRDVASVDCAVLFRPGDLLSNVRQTACPQRTRGPLQ